LLLTKLLLLASLEVLLLLDLIHRVECSYFRHVLCGGTVAIQFRHISGALVADEAGDG
jgi:hypothetical protein